MKIKFTAMLLAAALTAGMLTSCGESAPGTASTAPSSTASSKASAVKTVSSAASSQPADRAYASQTALDVSIGPEPQSLDPAYSTGADTDAYCAATFEGLYKIDESGNVVLGQAEKAVSSKDKKTWTFTLRQDAKWSDGKSVTANDFVYAWQRNILLQNAERKELFAYIQNGTAILNGTQTDVKALGVTAKDAHTLQVTLAAPCDFFSQLLVQPIFMPLREDVVSKQNWSRSPDTFVCNGPMKLTQWNIKSNITFERSTTYYNQAAVKAQKLNCTLAEDDNSRLSAYDNNECEFAYPLPVQYYARIRERGDLNAAQTATTVCLQFNTKNAALSDVQVRTALSLAVDRDALAVSTPGMRFTAASAFVPTGFADAGGKGDFRTKGGSFYEVTAETYPESAQRAETLLEQAGYANGKGFPEVTITVPISTLYSTVANAVAGMWKAKLGINCKVEQQPYSTYLDNCRKGNVQVTLGSLTAAYRDPAAILDKFTSGSGCNITGWSDSAFTKQMEKSYQSSTASAARFQALHAAETRLVEEAPATPLFYMPTISLRNPKVNGIFTAKNGITYFAYANTFSG